LVALGETEASRGILWTSGALFIAAGILNCGSRTGIGVLALTGLIMPLAFFRRSLLTATLVVGVVALVAYASADLGWLPEAFRSRGFEATRLVVWRDMWPIVADFPLFGVGLNAFGRAYRTYQTIYRFDYWAEAHNEYYQALLDMGLLGASLSAGLLWILFTRALRAAPRSALQTGLLGALSAQAVANVVDFNWQIPANAATFAALAGITLACEHEDRASRESSVDLSRSPAPAAAEAAGPIA
jgi:O-antigen ligase